MPNHIIPGVTFEKVANADSLIIPGSVPEVAFIGKAKTTRTIMDEQLVGVTGLAEWPGATASLAKTATGVESIVSVYDENGINYIAGVDADYYLDNDELVWTGITGQNAPAVGVKYYVSYEATKVAADYDYKTFYQLADVITEYGPAVSNSISLAADFFFNNGGVKLHIVQMDGDDLQAYTSALAKLETEELDVIVPLIAHDTTDFATLYTVTKSHVFQMSQVSTGKNRMAFLAPAEAADVATLVANGMSINYQRIMLTAPTQVVATVNGSDRTLSAVYLNAALVGIMADPDVSIAEPLTRKELFGFKSLTKKYLRGEVEALITAGLLVIEQIGQPDAPRIRVVQGITTDRNSIESNEITLVRVGDFFGKTLKNVLEKMYVGGQINSGTMASIRATINSVVANFVTNGVILRAEQVSATPSSINPTLVDVSLKLVPIYPLNFIDIKFTLGK